MWIVWTYPCLSWILWWVLQVFKSPLFLKQTLHTYGVSPVWTLMWHLRPWRVVKRLSHWLHGKGRSPVWLLSWMISSVRRNTTFCTIYMETLFHRCVWSCVSSSFVGMLLCDRKCHRQTLFHRVEPFYAYSSCQPICSCTHIGCIGRSHHHVFPSCA